MTPTELRALADALEPLASLERSGSQGALALESTIAYLRAQADAQPVAWIAHNLTTGHVKWTTDRCRARGWTRSVNLRVKPLYAHPAPAAPQAEPKPTPASGDDLNVYREMADGYRNDAQAEPKREPLSDEQIDAALQTDPAMILALMSGRMTVGEFKLALRRLARAVERAAYERAKEACAITCAKKHADAAAFRSTTKAYVAACDDCADAIHALGRQ